MPETVGKKKNDVSKMGQTKEEKEMGGAARWRDCAAQFHDFEGDPYVWPYNYAAYRRAARSPEFFHGSRARACSLENPPPSYVTGTAA